MESIINHEYIHSYSESFSDRIIDQYFSEHTLIDGESILNITEIQQVNLFLIKNIMIKWQDEARKVRSPFFNYASPEVQNALQDFMNVLSRNIAIEEKVFKPLLKMAVTDVLLLIFSPYDYFSTELLNIGSPVTLVELEKRKKFIKVNSELYKAYLEKIENEGADNLQIKEAKQYFDQVCEDINFSPEEPDEHIALFSKVIPFEVKKVYGEVKDAMTPEIIDQEIGQAGEDTKEEAAEPSGPEEAAEPSGPEEATEPSGQEEATEPSGPEEAARPKEQNKTPFHANFIEKKTTLVEELKKEPTGTVLDFHQKQKIESIKKNISIQQRFLFVRELFDEKDEFFNEAIDFLDNCSNNDDALTYLNEKFLHSGKWNNEDNVVIEFLNVVKKKFPD